MNRSRYEALPQSSPSSPPILLDPILNHPSYNYNSGTPTSVPSSAPSSHRPSITSISSRTPPPSFHSSQLAHLNSSTFSHTNTSNYSSSNIGTGIVNGTTAFPPFNPNGANSNYPDAPPSFHSRSSTPRPTPSTRTLASNSNMSNISGGSGVDLWGVATTTSGGTENGDEEEHRMGDRMGEEEDREGRSGLMMVKGLERRMERLEESIGRLLLENEELRRLRTVAATGGEGQEQRQRQNCCVSFTDASRDVEEAMIMNGHSNCCVRFSSSSSSSTDRKRRKKEWFLAILFLTALVTYIVVIVNSHINQASSEREGRMREFGRGGRGGSKDIII